MVDTKNVPNRRTVRYESLDKLLDDISQIEIADREQRLTTVGNWSAGQILAHVANWIDYGYVGYPIKSPPWFIKPILRLMLRKYLKQGMPSGVRIPGIKEGTVGMDPVSVSEGVAKLRKAIARLQSNEPCSYDSPAFGKMSHEDRIRLNLRHAELHLSFLSY